MGKRLKGYVWIGKGEHRLVAHPFHEAAAFCQGCIDEFLENVEDPDCGCIPKDVGYRTEPSQVDKRNGSILSVARVP